jgi:hypothetical protein
MPREPVALPARSLAAVPSPDDLRRDPALAEPLPPHALSALYADVARLEAHVRALMLGRSMEESRAPVATPDRAIGIDEAMTLLEMTKDFIYRQWPKLGGYKDVDGHVKFALSTVQRHIRTRAAVR